MSQPITNISFGGDKIQSLLFFIIILYHRLRKVASYAPGRRPLGRPRRRWEDNIRIDLEEIGINAGIWVESTQDRNYWRALVNAALNLRVP